MSDPTDPGGVSGAHSERAGRASTRVGDSGSPVGSPLTIVLAVIAVAAGFLIFRSIESDGAGSGGAPTTPVTAAPGASTTVGAGATVAGGSAAATTAPGATPTTTGGRVTDGGTVVVANASGIDGAAADMSTKLEAVGYTLGEPTSSTDDDNEPYAESIVYYAVGVGTEAVAQSVARDLGGVEVAQMPTSPLVDDLGGGSVLVFLGSDMANEDLASAPPAAPSVATGGTATTTTAG